MNNALRIGTVCILDKNNEHGLKMSDPCIVSIIKINNLFFNSKRSYDVYSQEQDSIIKDIDENNLIPIDLSNKENDKLLNVIRIPDEVPELTLEDILCVKYLADNINPKEAPQIKNQLDKLLIKMQYYTRIPDLHMIDEIIEEANEYYEEGEII